MSETPKEAAVFQDKADEICDDATMPRSPPLTKISTTYTSTSLLPSQPNSNPHLDTKEKTPIQKNENIDLIQAQNIKPEEKSEAMGAASFQCQNIPELFNVKQSPLKNGMNSKGLCFAAAGFNVHEFLLPGETLPEMSLLDSPCDSSMQHRPPPSRLTEISVNTSSTSLLPPQPDSNPHLDTKEKTPIQKNENMDLIQAQNIKPEKKSEAMGAASSQCQNIPELFYVKQSPLKNGMRLKGLCFAAAGFNVHEYLLPGETLPEMSPLDSPCDSTMQHRPPPSRLTEISVNTSSTSLLPPQHGKDKLQSANGTFTPEQPSKKGASTESNPCSQNHTLHLPPGNENSSEQIKDQTSSFASETSAANSSRSGKSSGNPVLRTTYTLQNNTYDCSLTKQNVAISDDEASSSQPDSVDKSSSKVGNLTFSFKDTTSDAPCCLECKENTEEDIKDANANKGTTPEDTFEAKPVLNVSLEAVRCESLDRSQSGQPVRDGCIDLNRRSLIINVNRAGIFNLDDSLDLKGESLFTSTPMSSGKMFNLDAGCSENRNQGAQRKNDDNAANNAASQASSNIPSNLVCDRKTFFKPPVRTGLMFPSNATSRLLKQKTASAIPELPSGRPRMALRTRAETLSNAVVSKIPPRTSEPLNSYNLRATTTGLKPLNQGLRRPQASAIPSGIQKAPAGLRPPLTRDNASTSSSTNKPCGPAVTNPATKISYPKKHPLSKGNALPSKRQKVDAAVPESAAVPLVASDTGNKSRILKQPSNCHRTLLAQPPRHGCANCVLLMEEIKKLKEENNQLKAKT